MREPERKGPARTAEQAHVPSSGPWLGIDYGAAYTKAVLMHPHGWTLLSFDSAHALSNAVHVGSGEAITGAAAWQLADTDPDGFIMSPLHADGGPVQAGGAMWDPADLVAATLRRVLAQAVTLAGGPVQDVRMVVPAGWGPRRRLAWRRAAAKAGLGQVRLVEAPVAVATQLAGRGDEVAATRWLVVDVGARCEVSVVARVPGSGFEVLATMNDPDAGSDRIDAALMETVTGTHVDEIPAGRRWWLRAAVREAKHALAQQPAVALPLADLPSVVVDTGWLREAARPVFERAGELARQVVASLDLAVDEIGAVCAVGASMAIPGAAQLIAEKLGVIPQVPEQAGFTAVLGVAEASLDSAVVNGPAAGPEPVPPSFRGLAGLALPGVLSLALYAHFVFSADFEHGTPSLHDRYYYVLASWGELTGAGTLALLVCLHAAVLMAVALPGWPGRERQQTLAGVISPGVIVAAIAGVAAGSLYAVTAAVYFAQPVGALLNWGLLPLLPTALCAILLAAVAWRRATPRAGWEAFLAFPLTSSVTASLGILTVSAWWTARFPAWAQGWDNLVGYLGGLLVGAAVAGTVTSHRIARILLTLLLGFLGAILSRSGPGILAVSYALTVPLWWAYRAWNLFRAAPTTDQATATITGGRT